jgi:type IV secretory pathway component VirB8
MSKNKNIITKLRIKASVAMMSKKKLRQYVEEKETYQKQIKHKIYRKVKQFSTMLIHKIL